MMTVKDWENKLKNAEIYDEIEYKFLLTLGSYLIDEFSEQLKGNDDVWNVYAIGDYCVNDQIEFAESSEHDSIWRIKQVWATELFKRGYESINLYTYFLSFSDTKKLVEFSRERINNPYRALTMMMESYYNGLMDLYADEHEDIILNYNGIDDFLNDVLSLVDGAESWSACGWN